MRIQNNKRYILNMGYDRLITPIGTPGSIDGKELRRVLQEDMTRARRYFGTAVMHSTQIDDKVYIDVTARKDERQALWGRWIVRVL